MGAPTRGWPSWPEGARRVPSAGAPKAPLPRSVSPPSQRLQEPEKGKADFACSTHSPGFIRIAQRGLDNPPGFAPE